MNGLAKLRGWTAGVFIVAATSIASAQTDLRVSGPQAGIPIAIPQMCDAGQASIYAQKIPETISKDLDLSGVFQVLNPRAFVESPGKCGGPESTAFSDWTIVGADGLVKGQVSGMGAGFRSELYLLDVQQKKAVLGKRYEADGLDTAKVAHRFANEIMKVFTGELGIFGTQVAFVSKIGRFKELYIMDLDGSNVRQLTRDRGLAMSPSWSPKGDSIVYMSFRTRRPQLYQISPSGGTPRQLTDHPEYIGAPEYSPDGNTVYAGASFNGFSNIVAIDLKSRAMRKLTSGSSIDTSPAPSPDGAQVAFTSSRGSGPQIYVVSTSGGTPQRVSFTGSNYCTSPTWSPKGDKIAFTCLSGGNQVFVAPVGGGNAEQLTFGGNNEDPTWSPDGRYLLFASGGGGSRSIVMMPLVTGVPKAITVGRSADSQPSWSPRMQ